ncbi:hypothetical protein [Deinococcus planocerae]|uniref:hypothetical protein n=1 Tax=Deinococcus planocerae TaxID=1737569 RepID=UPI0011AED6F3|nr:hypothetical protein [Deinococcus planocerae]
MPESFNEDAPSLLIALPAVTFGQGRGHYWRHLKLLSSMKRAIADQSCECSKETVDKHVALELIWQNVCSDLQKYAQDYPQTDLAELVRRGQYLEALALGTHVTRPEPGSEPSTKRTSLDTSQFQHSLEQEAGPSALLPWDEIVIAEAVGMLADSAEYLDSDHRFQTTITQIVLLLICKHAGFPFLNPHGNDVSAKYFQTLVTRGLMTPPEWMEGNPSDWSRLYKTWNDLYKAHSERIGRAKYLAPSRARPTSVYSVFDTGEIYFTRRLFEFNVQRNAYEARIKQVKKKAAGNKDYPTTLMRRAEDVGPDELLED